MISVMALVVVESSGGMVDGGSAVSSSLFLSPSSWSGMLWLDAEQDWISASVVELPSVEEDMMNEKTFFLTSVCKMCCCCLMTRCCLSKGHPHEAGEHTGVLSNKTVGGDLSESVLGSCGGFCNKQMNCCCCVGCNFHFFLLLMINGLDEIINILYK